MQTANKVWLTPREVEQMYGISRGVRVSRASLDAYMARRARDAGGG